jgi:hypothetical protein
VRTFAICLLLLSASPAPARDLAPEQVAYLKHLQATLQAIDDLALTPEQAERFRREHLALASKAAGEGIDTPAELGEIVRQHDGSRSAGYFTFVNIVVVFAGVLLALAIAWLCLVYVGPILMSLPPPAWEILAYAGVALGMTSGARWPALGVWLVVPAALLLMGALNLTHFLHFRIPPKDGATWRPGEGVVLFTYREFTALVCTLVWGAAAVYYHSYLLGFLSMMALQALVGFSALLVPGTVAVGFRRADSVPRATHASFVLLVAFVALHLTGHGEAPPLVYFRPGALFMGAFVYFLGLLILASRMYSGQRGNFVLMQVAMIASGVAAFFLGTTFGLDALLGIGGTFFVLYLLEKYTELPWRDIGWAWGLLGFAALLYGAAYLAGKYPQFFLTGIR